MKIIASHLTALAAMAMVAVTPVAAQASTAADTAADPDTLAAARGLLKVVDVRAQMRAFGPKFGQAMMTQMQARWAERQVPEGLHVQIDAALQDFIGSLDSAFTPQVIDQLATIYAQHYSAVDLRHLTQLMSDPVMIRFKAGIPSLLSEEMPVLFAAMKPQQDALRARVQQITADWIKSHPETKNTSKLAHPAAS